jgi:hypothetical protein
MILPRLKHLHSPDEMKFCSDRHRPANTFPPVFTGLSNFPVIEGTVLPHMRINGTDGQWHGL